MTFAAPAARATSAFGSDPTVPMTRTPWRVSHFVSISPKPPAAAWTRAVAPGAGRKTLVVSMSQVIPLTNDAAAVSGGIEPGKGIARHAGSRRDEA
jgi:hypothetical protein